MNASEKLPKTVLRDEQGGLSMARCLLLFQVLYVDLIACFAIVGAVGISGEWWVYQGTLTIGLVAWSAGPRGLQYLGPQIGAVTRGIAEAVKQRKARTDDRRQDDERR